MTAKPTVSTSLSTFCHMRVPQRVSERDGRHDYLGRSGVGGRLGLAAMGVVMAIVSLISPAGGTVRDQSVADRPLTAALTAGEVVKRRPNAAAGVPYYLYVPKVLDPAAIPLVVVHGISRNAEEHARSFAPLAEKAGRVLVAPFFTKKKCRRYQRVVIGSCRSDVALMTVLNDVSAATRVPVDRIDLFGFSGGSQFAHRFAMLYPDRVGRLALASAGWYTFPTEEEPFPYGIAASSSVGRQVQENIARFLAIPTLVVVGEEDVKRDRALRKERRVDGRQGRNRVERGARWIEALRSAALRYGIPPQAYFNKLPNCGHLFEDCVENADLIGRMGKWFER